ncbi:MAG: hypothetical protein ACYDHY_19590 [Acidiferrobacterales bacterium]
MASTTDRQKNSGTDSPSKTLSPWGARNLRRVRLCRDVRDRWHGEALGERCVRDAIRREQGIDNLLPGSV